MNLNTRFLLLTGLLVATTAAQAAVPTGAYIRRPVSSISDLIKHVKADPIVADRYVRHFRMNKESVISYLGTLHQSSLDHSGAYTVYNVHDNILRSRVLQLKKGTACFADSSGRPILLKICGNPMVWNLPPIGTAPVVGATATGEVPTASDEVTAVAMAAPVVIPGLEPVPSTPPVTVTSSMSRSRGENFLPLLALLGGAAFLIKDDNNDCKPVPEPATMVALASGVAVMARRRKKKNS
ncbi:MAG: PEP-CTERM sorting domain-containing protein [Fimbriimonadaceae bacterium]